MAASTGVLTASGIAVPANLNAVLYAVQSGAQGSVALTVTVYHGAAAVSGNEVIVHKFAANANNGQITVFKNPISCSDGMYVSLSTTGSGIGTMLTYDLA